MYNKNDIDEYLSENIQKNKEELQTRFIENIKSQEKTLDLLITGTQHSKLNKFKDTKLIWNIACFINIISLDLKVAGEALILSENEWKRRYYARQSCLIIYESINDFFDLLGKDFKILISSKICSLEIENELRSIKKELNFFKTKHFNELKNIRNLSIAHRDNDSLQQINSIVNISWSDTIEMVKNYDDIINLLGTTFQKLIKMSLEKFEELK